MGTEILAIIAGLLLRANPQWFHGAHTVGTVALWYGIGVLAVELVVLVLIAVGAIFSSRGGGLR